MNGESSRIRTLDAGTGKAHERPTADPRSQLDVIDYPVADFGRELARLGLP
jgi:hypothetical protein